LTHVATNSRVKSIPRSLARLQDVLLATYRSAPVDVDAQAKCIAFGFGAAEAPPAVKTKVAAHTTSAATDPRTNKDMSLPQGDLSTLTALARRRSPTATVVAFGDVAAKCEGRGARCQS